MTDSPFDSDAASRFFDHYLAALIRHRVPERQRRWYVKHGEVFIKDQNGRKIKTLSGGDVAGYFDTLGRREGLAGWQFAQRVDAIRILFCEVVRSPACTEVDWDFGAIPHALSMPIVLRWHAN